MGNLGPHGKNPAVWFCEDARPRDAPLAAVHGAAGWGGQEQARAPRAGPDTPPSWPPAGSTGRRHRRCKRRGLEPREPSHGPHGTWLHRSCTPSACICTGGGGEGVQRSAQAAPLSAAVHDGSCRPNRNLAASTDTSPESPHTHTYRNGTPRSLGPDPRPKRCAAAHTGHPRTFCTRGRAAARATACGYERCSRSSSAARPPIGWQQSAQRGPRPAPRRPWRTWGDQQLRSVPIRCPGPWVLLPPVGWGLGPAGPSGGSHWERLWGGAAVAGPAHALTRWHRPG